LSAYGRVGCKLETERGMITKRTCKLSRPSTYSELKGGKIQLYTLHVIAQALGIELKVLIEVKMRTSF